MQFHLFSYILVTLLVLGIAIANQAQGDLFKNDPNIYELTSSNFDKVIHRTNYSSIVLFYAPWCGYCQKLKPTFTKLGKFLHKDSQYSINVAAVNCDKDSNKALCSAYQIKGYPTMLVFRPPKHVDGKKVRSHRHVSEIYNADRSLRVMSNFLTSRLKNYVKKFGRLNTDGIDEWYNDTKKFEHFILISKAQQLSPLLKSIAIDFIDTVKFAMVSTKTINADVITIPGKEVTIPKENADDLPMLLFYNEKTGEFDKFAKTDKLNSKKVISKWIMEVGGAIPLEGPLSAKDKKFNSYYRKSEKPPKKAKVVEHDEL